MPPFEQIEWDQRTAEITDDSGKAIFKQDNVEVPKTWSELATKIAVSKYFYGDIANGTELKKALESLAAALVSAWLITVANIPNQVVAMLEPFLDNPKLLLILLMLLVMVVGTALDFAPTVLILTPVLMPLVKAAGIDPVYFGVLFIINNSIGLVTPPVGTVLNVVAGVGRMRMDDVTRGVMPFMAVQFIVMFLMVLFPEIVMVPARWLY